MAASGMKYSQKTLLEQGVIVDEGVAAGSNHIRAHIIIDSSSAHSPL
jgi:hypothetical protein